MTIGKRISELRKRNNLSQEHIVIIMATLLIFVLIAGAVKIYTLPVEWDAGACAGGYGTFIFDKYSESLVQKYLDGSDIKDEIVSIEAIKGTQEAEWKGRNGWRQNQFYISKII